MFNNEFILTELLSVRQGKVAALNDEGEILIETEDLDYPVPCFIIRTTEAAFPRLTAGDPVLFVVDAMNKRGFILGRIEPYTLQIAKENGKNKLQFLQANDKKVCLEATEEISIKCGSGSISMNKQGRIVIKGTSIVSRSSGPNKIKGATVNIN